jgi:CRP-like cAMP-binding protein
LDGYVGLNADLALGRRQLSARFHSAPPYTFGAGEMLVTAGRPSDVIHHLQGGWARQFRDLPDGRRAIVDIYLPGDVIGLDAALRIRPMEEEEVMTLTSLTIETRQRRADRFLAAISCLDARERLAMMVLDFYTSLSRRTWIAS